MDLLAKSIERAQSEYTKLATAEEICKWLSDEPSTVPVLEKSAWIKRRADELHLMWLKERRSVKRYLLTLTTDPKKVSDPERFEAIVKKLVTSRQIRSGTYVFEHMDSNMHCHMDCVLNDYYDKTKSPWKTYIANVGHIDKRNIAVDNGVLAYFSKENSPVSFSNEST